MEVTAIEIVEYSTQEVVESFDMRGKSVREVGRIESGMNRNLDHERFYTRKI